MTGTIEDDIKILSLENDSYERFFKKISEIPRSVTQYYLQFGQDEPIKAFRLFEQDKPSYDNSGKIVSTVKFVLVDEFSEMHVETYEGYNRLIGSKRQLEISRQNLPDRIWWYNEAAGMVEITWK